MLFQYKLLLTYLDTIRKFRSFVIKLQYSISKNKYKLKLLDRFNTCISIQILYLGLCLDGTILMKRLAQWLSSISPFKL